MFEYLRPTKAQEANMSVVRSATAEYACVLLTFLPEGPDRTYVIRKLRELAMWANVSITRHADGTPRCDGDTFEEKA